MLLIYLLVAAAIPLLLLRTLASDATTMYLFAAIFGLGLGGEYLIIPLMAGELFGVKVLGRVMGIVLTADGVAEATAPMLVGYLRDRGSSYSTGFITLVVAALVGAIAIALLPRRRGAEALGFGTRDSGFGNVDSALGTRDSAESRIPNPKSL
jgi:MFS family permease